MKRTIAIVAGGDSSEHDVSMRSARTILSFMDKERYNSYVVEMEGQRWLAHYEDGQYAIDRNDFSFTTPTEPVTRLTLPTSPFTVRRAKTVFFRATST